MANDKWKKLMPYAGLSVPIAAFLLLRHANTDAFDLLRLSLLLGFGYIVAWEDVKRKIVPNKLVLAMLSAWVLMAFPKTFVDIEGAIPFLRDAALGFVTGGGTFLLVYIVSRKGLGGGDVKFMAVAGLYLGFSPTLSAMLYGTIFAALTGLVLMALKKIGCKDAMPLTPFLYAGMLPIVLFA